MSTTYHTVQYVEHRFVDVADKKKLIVTVRDVETGVDTECWFQLEGVGAEITVKSLRALGWKCNSITTLEGIGSLKATLRITPNGKYVNTSIFPLREKKEKVAMDEAAKASFDEMFLALAATTEVIDTTDNNQAGALPQKQEAKPQEEASPF